MTFNLFSNPTKDDIKVGYVDPNLGYVTEITICEANNYAKDNPGTTFIFTDGNNNIRYLNINEVNDLTPNDLLNATGECDGIQSYRECGPPKIIFFGGDGVGAAANPIIGRDGSLLAVDIVRGGHGYKYPPITIAKDDCLFGNGTVLRSILGETPDQIEVFEGEEDFEEYELCEDTDVGYGESFGVNGENLGRWDPSGYTSITEDPIRREIDLYQSVLKNPYWTSRQTNPRSITDSNGEIYEVNQVTFPRWGEHMNKYAVSPVPPSDLKGSDYSGLVFNLEWEEYFPITGEYIFRGNCDNIATLFIDDNQVGKLNGFAENPKPIQKTVQEGSHIIRVELRNQEIYESTTTTKPNFVEVDFTVYGQGAFRDLSFSFTSEDGKDSFTILGAQSNRQTRIEKIKVRPGVKYKVKAKEDSTKFKGVEQGLVRNGVKSKELPAGNGNKIFADYTSTRNDNDDIQVTTSLGTFTSSNRRKTPYGRNTYDLTFEVPGSAVTSQTETTISPKSWNENPMGVSLSMVAPMPNIPQEQPPIQTGRCPPNPIWSTRFPGSSQKWYPVRFTRGNAWSPFMNRYAISPVLPLNTPGSDTAGVTFSNSWQIDLPYAGFYGVKGTRDNTGRLLIDGQEVSTLDGFNVTNPKLAKKYLTKGRHTITVEVNNKPQEIKKYVDTKVFSTQDWASPPTTAQSTEVSFDVYGQGAIKDLSFSFTSEDGKDSFTILGAQKTRQTRTEKIKVRPGINYRVVAKENSAKHKGVEQGLIKNGTKAKEAGEGESNKIFADYISTNNDNDDIQITASSGIFKSSNRRKTPLGRNTYDLIFRVEGGAPAGGSTTKNGVTYSGPTLFKYQDSRWSTYMNDFSISPKVFKSISQEDEAIIGDFTLKWTNVDFPQGGLYKFNFQADNAAIFKVDGVEVYSTSDFVGQKVQYTFNATAGKHTIEIILQNTKSEANIRDEFIFEKNPMGVALYISKDIQSSSSDTIAWTDNPMAVSAILIPPPCAKKISGRGVIDRVEILDPGNGHTPPPPQGGEYTVLLVLDRIIVDNPGINYNCGVDKIKITPSNGAVLDYNCDSFGRIIEVPVITPGSGFDVYPEITIESETGVNASFRPVFRVVRDPVQLLEDQQIREQLIQVTDLVGLKQTGYVDGRAYYGAVYYDNGLPYAGFYKTVGTQVRVYNTLQESITAQVTTAPSAIQRSGTDINSNNPRLNIPGTPQSTTEQ